MFEKTIPIRFEGASEIDEIKYKGILITARLIPIEEVGFSPDIGQRYCRKGGYFYDGSHPPRNIGGSEKDKR